MATFKSVPQPRSEAEFLDGAREEPAGLAVVPSPAHAADPDPRVAPAATGQGGAPWEDFDPSEGPTVNLTVRVNRYQHAQIVHLAESDDRPQQQILRRLIGPALAAAIANKR